MKLLKVLLALAVFSMGISAVLAADKDVVRNSISSDAGRIDYVMTYTPASFSATTTTASTAVAQLVQTDSVLSAIVSGISIDKAVNINSYIFAQSSGGDFADSQLTVLGTDSMGASGGDASVKNYGMYGYATNNLAYTGQYADSIKGEEIDAYSESYNKVDTTTLPIVANEFDPAQVGVPAILSTPGDTGTPWAYSEAYAGSDHAKDTVAAFTATKLYQFAQAGGSGTPSAYPMEMWSQSVNDKGHKLAILSSGSTTDEIAEYTNGEYYASPNRYNDADYSEIEQANTDGNGVVISPNAVSMGYADKNMAYSNEDTSLVGSDYVPEYDSMSHAAMGSSAKSTEVSDNAKPVGSGQKEFFVYSIVDQTHPSGLSDTVFW
jgi:hypothetical protein